MKYNIAKKCGEFDTRDAALLTQRLLPLARLYRNMYLLIKGRNGQLPEQAQNELKANMQDLAEEIVSQVLVFANENPYDIPHE